MNTSRSYATAEPSPLRTSLPTQNQAVARAGSITVGTETLPTEVATIGLFIRGGSALENQQTEGVSNILKYLIADGKVKKSGKRIAEEVENVGGRLHFKAGRETTAILAQVAKNDVEKAVEILGSIVENFKEFSSAETLSKAKQRVLRDIESEENDLDQYSLEHLHSIAYQTSSLGNPQKGSIAGVSKLTPDAVKNFAEKIFTSNRLVVAGVGGVDNTSLARLVGNYFGLLPQGKSTLDVEQPFIGSAVTVHDDSTDHVHATVAFQGTSDYSADYYTLQVIQEIIGNYSASSGVSNNSSTRLAELFGTEKLASRFSGFNISYAETGLVGVQVATTAEKLEDSIAEIITDYVRISQNARPAEVGRAKARVINDIRRTRDDTLSVALELGKQLLSVGRPLTLSEVLASVDEIDPNNVRKVASNHFVDTEPAVVAIGNTIEIPDYNQIRGWTNWWRT